MDIPTLRQGPPRRRPTTTLLPTVVPASFEKSNETIFHLCSFPAECNFSGEQFSLDWIEYIQQHGRPKPSCSSSTSTTEDPSGKGQNERWCVLLDAAKYAATNPLNLSQVSPDFVIISFYKLFGLPTGIGALFVYKGKKSKEDLTSHMQRHKSYFGGGTVQCVLPDNASMHVPVASFSHQFQDGTSNFLSICSLKFGLDLLERYTMEAIKVHVQTLTQECLVQLRGLHYRCSPGSTTKRPLVRVYGHDDHHQVHSRSGSGVSRCCRCSSSSSSSIVTFNLLAPPDDDDDDDDDDDATTTSGVIGFHLVSELAAVSNISFRTGCFCNPGACQYYLGLSNDQVMHHFRDKGHRCGDHMDVIDGQALGAIRISFGYMSLRRDIQTLVDFLVAHFLIPSPSPGLGLVETNPTTTTLTRSQEQLLCPSRTPHHQPTLLESVWIYPVKSCAGVCVEGPWPLTRRGLAHDREWMIIDNARGQVLSVKRCPALRDIQPRLDLSRQTLELHHHTSSCRILRLPLTYGLLSSSSTRTFSICGRKPIRGYTVQVTSLDDNHVPEEETTTTGTGTPSTTPNEDNVQSWLDFVLGLPNCSIIQCPRHSAKSFANDSSLLLMNATSVRWLEHQAARDSSVQHLLRDYPHEIFRPNLVVRTPEPFEEDRWKVLSLSKTKTKTQVTLDIVGPCARCTVVNVAHTPVLQHLAKTRRLGRDIVFGMYLQLQTTTGDELERDDDSAEDLLVTLEEEEMTTDSRDLAFNKTEIHKIIERGMTLDVVWNEDYNKP